MRHCRPSRGAIAAPLTLLSLLLAVVGFPIGASAEQGGLALSGSFYRQDFQIPQGSSVGGADIYVMVYNTGVAELGVKMQRTAPAGVNISFSEAEFTLAPTANRKVFITVNVGSDAAPGDYGLSVSAESYSQGSTGIQVAAAAAQTANLRVIGQAGTVKVRAITAEGQPLTATVRLYRISQGQYHEISSDDKGDLTAKVAPGDFAAALYVGGEKLAEQTFSVNPDETKTIDLSGATVYFEGFSVAPAYETGSGKLAFLKVVYTVRNLYKQVDKAEVTLKVTRDGVPVEQVPLATLGPLDIGRAGLNYNYIPAEGWVSGQYGFTLDLKLDGKPYAVSQEQTFNAGLQSKSSKTGATNPAVFAGAGAAALVLAGGVFLLLRRKKKA